MKQKVKKVLVAPANLQTRPAIATRELFFCLIFRSPTVRIKSNRGQDELCPFLQSYLLVYLYIKKLAVALEALLLALYRNIPIGDIEVPAISTKEYVKSSDRRRISRNFIKA
ncbi:MAG TPA: hypothetical protein VN844_19495 [Pyrinomonadaceae bacterium]|nr:hypothetical protein [Pyrinomonadaceae bacterium]